MAPPRSQTGGFTRDFGRAALFAVPLAVLAAWAWVELRELEAAEIAIPAPVVRVAEPALELAARPEPLAPYFGIKRPAAAVPPAPAPERPLPQARPADGGWEARAIPPPAVRAGAYVAIVIDDLGMDRARTQRLAAIAGPLTFAFLSYAPDIDGQSREARARGHEILLHMPMEPEGREDPGPGALRVTLSDDDIRARTAAALDRLPLAMGLNNHMGSRFTRDARALRPVLEELAGRGLLFLDSRTSGASVGADLARRLGVPSTGRDVFLDNEIDARAIRAQLIELERVASRRGSAVAIGHPHDATIDALAQFVPEMMGRGMQLVGVSAVVRQRARDGAPQLQALDLPPPASRNREIAAAPSAPVSAQAPAPSFQAARATPAAPSPVWSGGEVPWKRFPTE
jgi:polysaccharide deacetylase 2 family uncharacterized protein YibQ